MHRALGLSLPAGAALCCGAKTGGERSRDRAGEAKMKRNSRWRVAAMAAIAFGLAGHAKAAPVARVAFLGVQFLNDHEADEPTTPAERARLVALANAFQAKLEASGRFAFVVLPPATQTKIDEGPVIGSCGGCEYRYGADVGSDRVAWMVVQKVSNLILNLNVYVGDVPAQQLTFVHSVDIRGNTDESWTRGLSYLVKNYMLPATP
jgi:hypothetical protein